MLRGRERKSSFLLCLSGIASYLPSPSRPFLNFILRSLKHSSFDLTFFLHSLPPFLHRYPFYLLGSNAPSFLVWLRYSAFLLLYPLGMASEVALLLHTLPEAKAAVEKGDRFCLRLPGAEEWRVFNFYYFVSGDGDRGREGEEGGEGGGVDKTKIIIIL